MVYASSTAASCLSDTNDAASCAAMQKQGNLLYEEILDIDEIVQETIFRSIEEGGKMLESAIVFLKTELANVKVSSTSSSKFSFMDLYHLYVVCYARFVKC